MDQEVSGSIPEGRTNLLSKSDKYNVYVGRQTMKFLYIDVKKRKIVAVFQNAKGDNLFLSKDEVVEQKIKHQKLSSWQMIQHCDDALEAMNDYKPPKRWWKFW